MRKDISKMISYLRGEEEIDPYRNRDRGNEAHSPKATLKVQIGHLKRLIVRNEDVFNKETREHYEWKLRCLKLRMSALNDN